MWNGTRALRVIALVVFSVLSLSDFAFGRMRWAERDGKPVSLHPRRFGQEYPPVIVKIATACPSAICGNLVGSAITPLLALQPECSQQDFADSIISELRQSQSAEVCAHCWSDASRQFDTVTQANMISLAKEYRQSEKNTPPVGFSNTTHTDRLMALFLSRISLLILLRSGTLCFARRFLPIGN
jgi:hypothetical protein